MGRTRHRTDRSGRRGCGRVTLRIASREGWPRPPRRASLPR
jgi:hypothetical protein